MRHHELGAAQVAEKGPMIKRLIDIAISGSLLLLLAPLACLIALLIRLETPGPFLTARVCAGKAGQPFRLYHFRTMTVARADRPTAAYSVGTRPVQLYLERLSYALECPERGYEPRRAPAGTARSDRPHVAPVAAGPARQAWAHCTGDPTFAGSV